MIHLLKEYFFSIQKESSVHKDCDHVHYAWVSTPGEVETTDTHPTFTLTCMSFVLTCTHSHAHARTHAQTHTHTRATEEGKHQGSLHIENATLSLPCSCSPRGHVHTTHNRSTLPDSLTGPVLREGAIHQGLLPGVRGVGSE